jgi:hypothetical protein
MRDLLGNIVRLVFLVFFQALVVNRLNVSQGLILPQVYLFGLLMLPFATPRALAILVAFAVGLGVDMFTDTAGVHAAASLLMAFLLHPVRNLFAPAEGYSTGTRPTLRDMGGFRFLATTVVLVVFHHIALFTIEVFRWEAFGTTMLRILLSSIATLVLILIGQYLVRREKTPGI